MRRLINAFVAALLAVVLAGFTYWITLPAIPNVAPPEDIAPETVDDTPPDVLHRFREYPLNSSSINDGRTYRLILFPTFDRPILVEAHADANGISLKTKILDGKGGYEPGQLAVTEERWMTKHEWSELEQAIQMSEFWINPTDAGDDPVEDGAYWSLYAYEYGKIHSIHRITPKPKMLALFVCMLRLSGREKDYQRYWR